MNTQIEIALNATLADRQLLDHPFYRRWEAGGLSREELTSYAEQYRYFESMFPDFLQKLSGQLPEGPARDAVLDNLRDEISPPSHLSLFERFARWFDAGDADMSPAMSHLVDSYFEVLRRGPQASLAGLWAYEVQGAQIADSKADGLVRHYGAHDEVVAFWTAHGVVEDDHARWTLEALSSLDPDIDDMAIATRLIGEAWWTFLDERESLAA